MNMETESETSVLSVGHSSFTPICITQIWFKFITVEITRLFILLVIYFCMKFSCMLKH